MGLQLFLINGDGTTTEIETDSPIKDIIKTDECYVIVADDIRKVILWKGITSNVRSKFIGARISQEIRGQVGLHYAGVSVDEGDEDDDVIEIMGGKTEGGIAKEISQEKIAPTNPLRQKPLFDPPRPAAGMNIGGSSNAQNTGPLYTGQTSMATYMQDEVQVNFDAIMKKLDEIALPLGYERELIIIGNSAYSVVEKVQSFLGKTKVEKVIERVGSIPEGVFFAEEYSPRVLSEDGKILAIEFLKRIEGGKAKPATSKPATPQDKRKILKDQIKIQLSGK